ncbi:ferrochelatase [Erythrobacter sp. SCSIO 43205]|uniref:ferrochelatase n=1 Tax=Erythrobacter sp. SCSIO 43205 TaxID=2779361 RepID=UPI001CA828B1|nr:ferrochelatase [Erythrobacter sp. SCSIO 43205]UAB78779.1 ferrochelatase [Erythrobacter sp. SCSIO 43205]
MTWQNQLLPNDHPPVSSGGVGVLLVNLGTPDAPDPSSVKRYLKQFLSDKRVIEIPAIAWQPILRGIILNTRPAKSAEAYSKVWTDRGSPLADITSRQAEAIEGQFGENVVIDYAMRYGNPSIEDKLKALTEKGCDRILVAPLYPQYSAATTATVFDEVARVLKEMRWQPALRFLPPYHDADIYLTALADDLTRQLKGLSFKPETMLLSFHGMPQRTLEKGDPYHCHCQKTSRLLREKLEVRPEWQGVKFVTTFQSRFGPAQWLEPATDDTLVAEGEKGTKRLVVAAPGFSADCVETLEELALEGRDEFLEAGGEEFAVMECLNTSGSGIEMLKSLIGRELSGWI